MLGFSVLGSGSEGNSTLVENGDALVLFDAGFSYVETERRLERIGKSIFNVSAIVLSHEHGDHANGAPVIVDKCPWIEVFMSRKTRERLERDRENKSRSAATKILDLDQVNIFDSGSKFDIGKLAVQSFPVLHDAADPCGFQVTGDGVEITIALDVGSFTAPLVRALNSSVAVVLESNYSEMLIDNSTYPEFVKTRIRSSLGHLSNEQVESFLLGEFNGNPVNLILAHRSQRTNTEMLPAHMATQALKKRGFDWIDVKVAKQDKPLQMVRF